MDVRGRIRRYFSKAASDDIGEEEDIFDSGIVDSMFAIQLVLFVEAEFAITAERDDLDINNFCSISALTRFVEAKLDSNAVRELGHGHPSN